MALHMVIFPHHLLHGGRIGIEAALKVSVVIKRIACAGYSTVERIDLPVVHISLGYRIVGKEQNVHYQPQGHE